MKSYKILRWIDDELILRDYETRGEWRACERQPWRSGIGASFAGRVDAGRTDLALISSKNSHAGPLYKPVSHHAA
jgi:hypothetical protein